LHEELLSEDGRDRLSPDDPLFDPFFFGVLNNFVPSFFEEVMVANTLESGIISSISSRT
jgi:hypothetical protein